MDPREIALGPLHVSGEGAAAGVEAVELRGHAKPRVEYEEVFCRKKTNTLASLCKDRMGEKYKTFSDLAEGLAHKCIFLQHKLHPS